LRRTIAIAAQLLLPSSSGSTMQGVSMQLWATVGRFRCRNPACSRKIFCERLPRIARVYGRQTERAAEIVRLIGYLRAAVRPSASCIDCPSRRVTTLFYGACGTILRKCAHVPCRTWEWTIGLGARARSMERFWSIWMRTALLIFFRIEPPTASPNGSGTIRKS
jgi:hypothetical protein